MITGRLENWWWDENNSILWGNIYDDERKRFYDGRRIHTSLIDKTKFKEFEQGDVVSTLNSSYLLGQPFTYKD